jgi:hypothetical protein
LSITVIPQIVGALKGNLEIARGGGGAISMSELQAYAGLAYHLPPGHQFRDSIDPSQLQNIVGPGGASVLSASQASVDAAVTNFLHPDLTLARRAGSQALGIKAKAKHHSALKPSQITTLVLNAGSVPGRAANTEFLLRQLGYRTDELPPSVPANAPSQTFETNIYYDAVQPNAKQAAQRLSTLFGAHSRVVALSPAISPYAQQAGNPLTVVAFGTSFDGTLTNPAPRQQAPPRQPADVSDGVEPTLSALRQVEPRAGLRLMLPHEIANGSVLSSMDGVRAYRPLQHQHSVVLTYVTPAGNVYWQIEETTWNTAPILGNPTGHVTFGGRHYDLYTNNGHIHMIVLRTPNASYWVVNTLLDALSNETMVAIAKSLRPLGK